MKRVIWVKTARVYAQDSDMTAKVERTTVKLEEGDNFNKFVKYANLKGYKKDEPPYIEKVMDSVDGKWVEVDKTAYSEKLIAALKTEIPTEKIDFKALAETQAKELESTKSMLNELAERMKALEEKKIEADPELRAKLETKATELGIKFRENIGNEKLLAKINEVEPDFK